jgi:hypothetical protein
MLCVDPPNISISLPILGSPKRFDFVLYDRKRFSVFAGFLFTPTMEVDDVTTRFLIRLIVEFLTVYERGYNFGVIGVAPLKFVSFVMGEKKTIAEKDNALKNFGSIFGEIDRFTHVFRVLEKRTDYLHLFAVEVAI